MSPWLSELLLRSQSDERLVSLARAGHDRAFAIIVERYRSELLAHARRLVSDGRAEDVLQQAFLSAFTALRSGTEVRHVRGWLYQIVRNAAGKTRSPAELPLDEVTVSSQALEDVVMERALAHSAMTELARLPERQRDALVGMALNGLGRAELATSMGLSEGAVRQLVHRARSTVRSAVTAVTPWPLARWLAAAPGGGASELAATAGAVSTGGIALKFGAVLTTAAVATGVAVVPAHHAHHARAVAGAGAHARAGGASQAPAGAALAVTVARHESNDSASALSRSAGHAASEKHRGRGRRDGGSESHPDRSGGERGQDQGAASASRGARRSGSDEVESGSRGSGNGASGSSGSDDGGSRSSGTVVSSGRDGRSGGGDGATHEDGGPNTASSTTVVRDSRDGHDGSSDAAGGSSSGGDSSGSGSGSGSDLDHASVTESGSGSTATGSSGSESSGSGSTGSGSSGSGSSGSGSSGSGSGSTDGSSDGQDGSGH